MQFERIMHSDKDWSVFVMLNTFDNDIHIVPNDDLIEHDFSDSCLCGPVWEPRLNDHGYLYTHHSLDGREMKEKDENT